MKNRMNSVTFYSGNLGKLQANYAPQVTQMEKTNPVITGPETPPRDPLKEFCFGTPFTRGTDVTWGGILSRRFYDEQSCSAQTALLPKCICRGGALYCSVSSLVNP